LVVVRHEILGGLVQLYRRERSRPKPERGKAKEEGSGRQLPRPTDPVFPGLHIKLFNGILKRAELKLDREGHKRTAYSLRHTYICMRLTEGADIYQIAKNCRTSVEMIQRFYAAHIMNSLDAAAINVMRPTPRQRRKPADLAAGEDRRPQAAQPIILPESPESSAEL
jgi:integrase